MFRRDLFKIVPALFALGFSKAEAKSKWEPTGEDGDPKSKWEPTGEDGDPKPLIKEPTLPPDTVILQGVKYLGEWNLDETKEQILHFVKGSFFKIMSEGDHRIKLLNRETATAGNDYKFRYEEYSWTFNYGDVIYCTGKEWIKIPRMLFTAIKMPARISWRKKRNNKVI